MDKLTASLIGLGILAALILGFFYVFRGKGKFSLRTPFGQAKAEGENPPPLKAVAGGVRIKDAEAGRDVHAQSTGDGGVDLEKVRAKRDIHATHEPGGTPPKA
jgi:hypothetical protein